MAIVVARLLAGGTRIVGTLGDIAARLAAEPAERTAIILVGRALAADDFREVLALRLRLPAPVSGKRCDPVPNPLIPAQAEIQIFRRPASRMKKPDSRVRGNERILGCPPMDDVSLVVPTHRL